MNTSLNIPLTLRLMREEVKSRKLASLLHQLGVEEQCKWLPSFNDPIAESLGLETDEDFNNYDLMMDAIACKISNENDLNNVVALVGRFLGEIEYLKKLKV